MSIQTQLGDLSTGQLLEAARHVRDLQGRPGWTLVRGLIEVEIERVQTQLLNASLPSYEKLAQLQGELRGLKLALGVADQVTAEAQAREAVEQALVEGQHV